MGKLVVYMFMTLDGVIQAPEGGFGYGGWQAPYVNAEAGQLIAADYASLDALLLGRKTYEIFAPYWQQASFGQQPVHQAVERETEICRIPHINERQLEQLKAARC